MRRGHLVVCVAAALLVGRVAAAQEAGQVGVTMGYPTAVGVLWHLTSRVAIEPEIAISRIRAESQFESTVIIGTTTLTTAVLTTTTDGWTSSPGVALRIYVAKWDNVSTYVAPAYSYHRTSTTTTTTAPITFPGSGTRTDTRKSLSEAHEMRAMFGVQYAPHRKFSVFGEVGLRYADADLPRVTSVSGAGLGSASSSGTTKSFGNATAVGIAFYF